MRKPIADKEIFPIDEQALEYECMCPACRQESELFSQFIPDDGAEEYRPAQASGHLNPYIRAIKVRLTGL